MAWEIFMPWELSITEYSSLDQRGNNINRFGGQGNKDGQLQAPSAIAVDGRGRVFVSDMKGIQMFDGDGRYLGMFKPDGGHASGMVFNDKNELFVVDRTKVVKVQLKE